LAIFDKKVRKDILAIFPFCAWYSMLKVDTPPSPNVFFANETTSCKPDFRRNEENSSSKGLSPMILLKTDFLGTRKGWFSATFGFVSFSEIKFFTSAVPLSVMVNSSIAFLKVVFRISFGLNL
jgi:hypothetical protein